MYPRENMKNSLFRDTSVSCLEQKGSFFLFVRFGQVVKNTFSVYAHFLSGEKFPFQGYFLFLLVEKTRFFLFLTPGHIVKFAFPGYIRFLSGKKFPF